MRNAKLSSRFLWVTGLLEGRHLSSRVDPNRTLIRSKTRGSMVPIHPRNCEAESDNILTTLVGNQPADGQLAATGSKV
jgi:hypothetical protein